MKVHLITLALVDDHPTLLEGLRSIFGRRDGYSVVATGGSCESALQIAVDHKPDIVILDLNMPGEAFACIRQIRNLNPAVRVLAFTASASINHAIDALQAGAHGYVLKGSSLDCLIDAIETVMAGDTYISKGLATKVIAALTNPQGARIKLSTREQQIVALLLESRTNREMAEQMHLSEKTIKNYMSLLMQKLKVRNRVGLVMATKGMPLGGAFVTDIERIGLSN